MNLNYIMARTIGEFGGLRINWPYMVANLGYPMSLLVVSTILSQGKLLPFALAGALISSLALNGISMAAAIAPQREHKYVDMMIVTKVSPIDYMIGELLGQIIWSTPSIALYLVLDTYFGLLTPITFLFTLLIGILVLLSTSEIAFWLTSFVKSNVNVYAMTILMSLVLVTITPTFYPYTYVPSPILTVLQVLPTASGAMLEQGLFGLEPMHWYLLGVLIVDAVVFFIVAKQLTRWRDS